MSVLAELMRRLVNWLFNSWSSRGLILNTIAAAFVGIVVIIYILIFALRINYDFRLGITADSFW